MAGRLGSCALAADISFHDFLQLMNSSFKNTPAPALRGREREAVLAALRGEMPDMTISCTCRPGRLQADDCEEGQGIPECLEAEEDTEEGACLVEESLWTEEARAGFEGEPCEARENRDDAESAQFDNQPIYHAFIPPNYLV